MHAALTTTQAVTDEQDPIGVAAIAGEEMARWLRELEGFRGLLMLTSPETATTQVLSFWESREIAESHRASRLRLRDRVTADRQRRGARHAVLRGRLRRVPRRPAAVDDAVDLGSSHSAS